MIGRAFVKLIVANSTLSTGPNFVLVDCGRGSGLGGGFDGWDMVEIGPKGSINDLVVALEGGGGAWDG